MLHKSLVHGLVSTLLFSLALPAGAQIARGKHAETPAADADHIRPTGRGHGEPSPYAQHNAGGTNSNGIAYHGGPVMLGTTNVYVIWYGNWTADTAGQSILLNELSYIGGSSYFNINTTYYNGSLQHVSNAVHYAGSANDSYSQGTSLTDAGVQGAVNRAITLGHLPKDSHGVYLVLSSKDVPETSGFCTQYCGWHTHAAIAGADVKFAFIGNPDSQCPSACEEQTGRSPNGDPGADGMASVIAHELQESVTDPDLNAWYDASGEEDSDKCAWNFGSTRTASNTAMYNVTWGGKQYLIQQNWVNARGGYCAMSW
jgi:hypothetical protein